MNCIAKKGDINHFSAKPGSMKQTHLGKSGSRFYLSHVGLKRK